MSNIEKDLHGRIKQLEEKVIDLEKKLKSAPRKRNEAKTGKK